MKEDDVLKILAAQLHVGSKDVDHQMNTYVWKKKPKNEGRIKTLAIDERSSMNFFRSE